MWKNSYAARRIKGEVIQLIVSAYTSLDGSERCWRSNSQYETSPGWEKHANVERNPSLPLEK